MSPVTRRLTTASVALLLAGCAHASPAPPAAPAELDISATRPITETHRRAIGFRDRGVWVSNEFEGGRFTDAWMEGDSILVIHNRPENAPINNSAWYAFDVWSRSHDTVTVRFTYEDGRHRYWPKVRRAGDPGWTPLDSALVRTDSVTRGAVVRLPVGPDTVRVAGQEMRTSAFFDEWIEGLTTRAGVSTRVIATTPGGRPIRLVHAGDPGATRHVLLIGRQHPPEVTGTKAMVAYVEEMLEDAPLAREFRERFQIHVIPLVNPDGVDLGHWRHNTGGVDLNRDWVAFHQPEPRAVRDEARRFMAQPGSELWFFADFHSTNRDVFYTLERSLETKPAGVTDRWLDHLRTQLPHYEVRDSPSGMGTPMSRNWVYREFDGAPGLIYEVGDDTDPALIRQVAEEAARGTMRILLDELRRQEGAGGR